MGVTTSMGAGLLGSRGAAGAVDEVSMASARVTEAGSAREEASGAGVVAGWEACLAASRCLWFSASRQHLLHSPSVAGFLYGKCTTCKVGGRDHGPQRPNRGLREPPTVIRGSRKLPRPRLELPTHPKKPQLFAQREVSEVEDGERVWCGDSISASTKRRQGGELSTVVGSVSCRLPAAKR